LALALATRLSVITTLALLAFIRPGSHSFVLIYFANF
jgi:hypothetical protein